jgi:hypothetical protein
MRFVASALTAFSGAAGCEAEPAPAARVPEIDSCAICAQSDAGPDCKCVAPLFQSQTFDGCLLGSPLRYDSADGPRVIVASGDGRVAAISPRTGKTVWSVALPVARNKMAHVIATPALADDGRLVVAWQEVPAGSRKPSTDPRHAHFAAVVDLERGVLDPEFPLVTLKASQTSTDGDPMDFRPEYELSRSALAYAPAEKGRGYVYVSFGNALDLQPWHGWVLELDLDAWHEAGAKGAISASLVTTAETDCGDDGHSGSHEKRCGGGVWAPAGPQVVTTDDGFELIVPTGNGALDPTRRDYSHTLMRIRGPGLKFEDGCDAAACGDWDIGAPSQACMQSCENLFIPRFANESTTFDMAVCGDKSFFDCYSALDWDLGSGSPAVVDIPDGPRALALPAKDGGLYLADFAKLGTLYDRMQLLEPCGSHGGACRATWAGMSVTKPEITEVDDQAFALVATFNADNVNSAGLVAVRIAMKDGVPHLERAWEAPSFDSPDSITAFRNSPGRPRLFDLDRETHAAVVDIGTRNRQGLIYVVRVRDGAIVARQSMLGAGQHFSQPLAIGSDLFIPSCENTAGPGQLEAWRVR